MYSYHGLGGYLPACECGRLYLYIYPNQIYVESVVEKVALEHAFLGLLRDVTFNIVPLMHHTCSFITDVT